MGITLELIETLDFGMMSREISKEVAYRAVIVPGGIRIKRSAEGVHGTAHQRRQRMVGERNADHGSLLSGGRRHCATARVYSR